MSVEELLEGRTVDRGAHRESAQARDNDERAFSDERTTLRQMHVNDAEVAATAGDQGPQRGEERPEAEQPGSRRVAAQDAVLRRRPPPLEIIANNGGDTAWLGAKRANVRNPQLGLHGRLASGNHAVTLSRRVCGSCHWPWPDCPVAAACEVALTYAG